MILVFDVGGTMTKYGIYQTQDQQHVLITQGDFPSLAIQGGQVMLDRLKEEVDRLLLSYDIKGIAISSAGQINPYEGEVVFATDNIPNYTGMNPVKMLSSVYQMPVAIENDVNCFLLGEQLIRHLNGNVLGLTLGTGIGGAILSNDSLVRGDTYSAGEIGHIQLVKNGLECTCGNNGCYEQYASTNALKNSVKQSLGYDDLKIFFEQCKNGDSRALELYDAWIDLLTDGLRTLIHILNPNTVIIGGAIAAQGQFLEAAIQNSIEGKIMASYARNLKIVVSDNGNTSNLLGALNHFYNQYPDLKLEVKDGLY